MNEKNKSFDYNKYFITCFITGIYRGCLFVHNRNVAFNDIMYLSNYAV